MKKSKLAVGLLTALLSVGTLASCDNTVKYSKDGVILTYVDGNGKEQKITADQLFIDYYNDSSKYQSIFDSINSIVVRNYFSHEEIITSYQGKDVEIKLGKSQMSKINTDAQFKVDSDKRTAKTTADTNDTSYNDEFDAILKSKGVETEDELFDSYVEELQKETFDENFYKYHIGEIKNGADDVKVTKDGGEVNFWNGYFKDMAPYHVSHILVKLEDGSGTNYSNGTISKENAEKLFNVVEALKNGDDSFGTIAYQFSEDTGSAKSYGDLGIMDYSTGYVNEFKLGVYAYENLITKKVTETDAIAMPNTTDFQNVITDSFGLKSSTDVPAIPYSVFKTIKDVADTTKDENDKAVIEDSTTFYPRNVMYNKYLNRHSVAFVVDDAANPEATGDQTVGFHTYVAADGIDTLTTYAKPILSVKVAGAWTPILAVRAGSDYQGIHFIVVDRSPFTATDGNGVSLDDYYTTYYPEQDGYPTVTGKTYVNFSSTVTADTKSRADSLKSTLKSYDSDKLSKYIFRKYFKMQGLKIADEKLAETLDKWIDRGIEKKEQETQDSWEKTWNSYVDTLRKQNSERNKLVSEACRIGYLKGNSGEPISDADWDAMKEFLIAEGKESEIEKWIGTKGVMTYKELFKEEGGLCNDGKAHL